MSNCFGTPAKDLVLNNLVICDKAVINDATIKKIKIGNFDSSVIPFTSSPNFALTQNNSSISGNMVQISLSGNITGDIAATQVPMGNIPVEFAPLNDTFSITCQIPAGILVFILDSSGFMQTCINGFPFPIGTYPVSLNIVYLV